MANEKTTTEEKADKVRKQLEAELKAEGKSPEEIQELLEAFGV